MTENITLVIIGLLIGLISGMLGIGGGAILIPILMGFYGFSIKQAIGTSSFFLVFPIGLLAALNYYKAGFVNIKYAIILALSFFIGAFLGSIISIKLPISILKKIFAIYLLILGIKLLVTK